jgi:hypothetical protein
MVLGFDPHLGGALWGVVGELPAWVSPVWSWRGGLHQLASFCPPGFFLVRSLVAPAATASLWRRGMVALVFQALVVLVQEAGFGRSILMLVCSGADLREKVVVCVFCSGFGWRWRGRGCGGSGEFPRRWSFFVLKSGVIAGWILRFF